MPPTSSPTARSDAAPSSPVPGTRADELVPFLDVAAPYRELGGEVEAALRGIFASGRFAQGPWVERLETELARYCGTRHAVAVSSGTEALCAALRALGLRPGDEVITTALSFVATAEAVVLAGGRPVFVDVDPRTLQLDANALEAALGPRTVGVLPVHLYGATGDLDAIAAFAERSGLWMLEDAAQAHGARHRGRRAGSLGAAGCFSFYPGKNLGTCGEGGALVTDDDDLAREARLFRDHGARTKYEHVRLGTNARMSEIEAAVLCLKLPHLDRWNDARRAIAAVYDAELAGLPLELTRTRPECEPVHHLYVVRADERDALRQCLDTAGIATGIHYPTPLHLVGPVGGGVSARGSLPAAESAAERLLSLPMFPELGAARARRAAAALRELVDPAAPLPRR